MIDRRAAWFLFLLCFVAACFVAVEVLKKLQRTTETVMVANINSPGFQRISKERSVDLDRASMNLWFESLNHEKEATGSMMISKDDEAFKKLEDAIEAIEQIHQFNPEFRPDYTGARISELKEKREQWKAARLKGINPVSDNEAEPAKEAPAPAIENPAVDSPTELAASVAPTIGEAGLNMPPIGSGLLEPSTSPGIIKWDGADHTSNDKVTESLPSPAPKMESDSTPVLNDNVLLAGNDEALRSAFQGSEVSTEVTSPAMKPVTVKPDIEVMNSDPSSIWYRAFAAARKAKELEGRGEMEPAREKYHEAKTCYDILNNEFPEFESEHIRNGSELLAAKLNKLNNQ